MGTERYYFNIISTAGTVPDLEGSELQSLEAARAEAIEDARALMSDAMRRGLDISSRSIEICNGAGEILLIVPFGDAVIARE